MWQVSTDQASQAAAPAQAPQTAGKDPPWMPSRDRHKQSFLPRRMAHLTRVRCQRCLKLSSAKHWAEISACAQVLEDELAAKAQAERKLPDFDTGDALELQLVCSLQHWGAPMEPGLTAGPRRSRPRIRGASLFSRACASLARTGATARPSPCATTSPTQAPSSALSPCEHLADALALLLPVLVLTQLSYDRYSPTIKSIKVLQTRKVRRAKLFYLRDRLAKEYRV